MKASLKNSSRSFQKVQEENDWQAHSDMIETTVQKPLKGTKYAHQERFDVPGFI